MLLRNIIGSTTIICLLALNPITLCAENNNVERVTDDTFKQLVYKSRKPTAVFFTANNDDPSFEYARTVFEKIIEKYPNDLNFFEYNLGKKTPEEINLKENRKELFEKYGVWIVPSIAYGVKKRVIGVFSALPVKDLTKEEHEMAIVDFAFNPELILGFKQNSVKAYKKALKRDKKDLLNFE